MTQTARSAPPRSQAAGPERAESTRTRLGELLDETGDGQLAQGWCPTVVDTNGDGRITKPWNEPSVSGGARFEEDATRSTYDFDPALDTRVAVGAYGIIVNPEDGSVWGAQDSYPGKISKPILVKFQFRPHPLAE